MTCLFGHDYETVAIDTRAITTDRKGNQVAQYPVRLLRCTKCSKRSHHMSDRDRSERHTHYVVARIIDDWEISGKIDPDLHKSEKYGEVFDQSLIPPVQQLEGHVSKIKELPDVKKVLEAHPHIEKDIDKLVIAIRMLK